MEEKNLKLAKENNLLKACVTEEAHKYEEILQRNIKGEYYADIFNNQIITAIDESIESLEGCLKAFKEIKTKILIHKQENKNIALVSKKLGSMNVLKNNKLGSINVLKEKNVIDIPHSKKERNNAMNNEGIKNYTDDTWRYDSLQYNDSILSSDTSSILEEFSNIDLNNLESNSLCDSVIDEQLSNSQEIINRNLLKQLKRNSIISLENDSFKEPLKRPENNKESVFIKKRKGGTKTAKSERLRTLKVFKRTDT